MLRYIGSQCTVAYRQLWSLINHFQTGQTLSELAFVSLQYLVNLGFHGQVIPNRGHTLQYNLYRNRATGLGTHPHAWVVLENRVSALCQCLAIYSWVCECRQQKTINHVVDMCPLKLIKLSLNFVVSLTHKCTLIITDIQKCYKHYHLGSSDFLRLIIQPLNGRGCNACSEAVMRYNYTNI